MRSKREVREKFEELQANRMRKRKEEFLSQTCRNCVFNERVHVKGHGKVRICQNPEVLNSLRREVLVCEDDEVARRCSKFDCRNTKEDVERDFDEILKSPSRCGDVYPKLALLIWFLQGLPEATRWGRLKNGLTSFCRSFLHVMLFRWW